MDRSVHWLIEVRGCFNTDFSHESVAPPLPRAIPNPLCHAVASGTLWRPSARPPSHSLAFPAISASTTPWHRTTESLPNWCRGDRTTYNFMAKVLGIDLGTTNSCMAVMEGGEPLVLENSKANAPSRPSPRSPRLANASLATRRSAAVTNSRNTIYSVKRFMGRKFDEVRKRSSACLQGREGV